MSRSNSARPVGWPIQYRVDGRDAAEVRSQALKARRAMATIPTSAGSTSTGSSRRGSSASRSTRTKPAGSGCRPRRSPSSSTTVLSGEAVTQVRDDIYLVDVRVLARDEERVSIDTLRSLQVQVPGGRTVPISQFVRIGYAQDTPLLWREGPQPDAHGAGRHGPRRAAADRGRRSRGDGGEVSAGLPAGYRIEVGGTVEASAESQASVVAVFPLMILVMLTVLMFQLKSFQRLVIVLAIAPLGLVVSCCAASVRQAARLRGPARHSGVIGIITKNAVILVDQIESEGGRSWRPRGRRDGRDRRASGRSC